MAARPARRPARPNPTRERILEASWRLFNELGVPNVTTNHIADEVDISPGNLYYHFRHKEDIVNALYDRYEQRFSDVLGYSADELSTPDDLWLALHLAFEIIYAYRFIYRDLSDLTTAYPGLRLRFQRSLEASIGKTREYLCVRDVAGLVALVQMGTLEIHLWGSRATDVERPDVLIFDLDPAPDVAWKAVVRGARELRALLDGLALASFVKTSGGKGLHVVVPIEPELEWPEVKAFCRTIAEHLEREAPERYVANMSLAKRTGKIFVDYLRNGRGATAVAPYSTRATGRAPIATPVTWDEIGRVRPDQFDLSNIERRLARGTDPWASMSRVRSSLPEAIRAFEGRR